MGKMGLSKNFHVLGCISLIFLLSDVPVANAAAPPNPQSIRPVGVSGSMGYGFTNYVVKSPSQNFSLDNGMFASLAAERGFNFLNLYLDLSLNYLSTTGTANYDYTTLSGVHYTASDVAFQTNLFEAGLGLKLKIIDRYWVRPYVEYGGLGGYYSIRYTNKASVLSATGSDYKTTDNATETGQFGEAGLEISFSDKFGIRSAARYTHNTTDSLMTLGNQPVQYDCRIYYFALLAQF